MKLFYQQPRPNVPKIHEAAAKGYGVKHPERINGYEGAFLFFVPDVYISDKIERRMDVNPWLKDRLMDMLARFKRDDYGFVTESEQMDNGETRYLSGSSSWMIARYESSFGGIIYETFFDISMFYFADEDVSDVWQQQEQKRQDWYTSKGYKTESFCRRHEMYYRCPNT